MNIRQVIVDISIITSTFSLSGVHRYPPTVVETKWKIVSKKPLQHILEIRNLSETQHRGHSGTL